MLKGNHLNIRIVFVKSCFTDNIKRKSFFKKKKETDLLNFRHTGATHKNV